MLCNFIVTTNKYQLPISFFITFLPFDGRSLNWAVNYAFQVTSILFGSILGSPYIMTSVMFLNHSCWEVDVIITEGKRINIVMADESPAGLVLGRSLVDKKLKKIIQLTLEMLDWQNRVRNLLKISFLVEFTLLSLTFGLCIYVIISEGFGSFFSIAVMLVSLFQLYLYCWMGNRVISKIGDFAAELYGTKWYLMSIKQQKDLEMILIMMQNAKEYHGVFNSLKLETFQKVTKEFRFDQFKSKLLFNFFSI